MIGQLRDRVEILRPVRTPDGGGGHGITYTSLGTVAARHESRRAAGDGALGAVRFRRRATFLIRHRPDLVFEMRLVHQGRHYRITDIQERQQGGRFTLVEGEEAAA